MITLIKRLRFLIFLFILLSSFLFFFLIQTTQSLSSSLRTEGDDMAHYTISSHIIKYQEYPLLGPYNSGTKDIIKYSPFFFYFLAFFLLIYDSFFTLQIISILLLTITFCVSLYFLMKQFGICTAISFGAIYLTTSLVHQYTGLVWLPLFALPLITGTFIFLSFAYFTKKKYFYYLSLILFSLSITFHTSTLGFTFWMFFLIFLLWKQNVISVKEILIGYILFFLCLLFTHFPILFYYIGSETKFTSQIPLEELFSIKKVINTYSLFYTHLLYGNWFFMCFILISSLVYFLLEQNVLYKRYFFILFLGINLYLFSMSFSRFQHGVYFFLLAIPFFTYSLGIIWRGWTQISWKHIGVGLVVTSCSLVLLPQVINTYTRLTNTNRLTNQQAEITQGIEALEKYIRKEKEKMHYPDFYFFTLSSFYPHASKSERQLHFISDTVLLTPLEYRLETKILFLKNDPNRIYQIASLPSPLQFTVCYHPTQAICAIEKTTEVIYSSPSLTITVFKNIDRL